MSGVRNQPPPAALLRVLNPTMRRLLPTPAGRLFPNWGVLRFTGRRSGRAFAVPVGVYDHGSDLVVFTDSGWRANFRDGLPVEVVRRGRATAAHGRLVTDPAYVGPALRATMAAGTSARMLGISLEGGHVPTDEEVAAIRDAVVLTAAS